MNQQRETYTQRLAKVRECIDKILSGSQSWRFNDRQYTRADLSTLHAMEKHYAKLAAREPCGDGNNNGKRGAGRNSIRYIRI